MKDASTLIDSIAHLAWPILVALVLWRLLPLVKDILRSREFSIKIGDFQLSVQQATDQIRSAITDLQDKVEELRTATGLRQPVPAPASSLRATPNRILWTDDRPENNAMEIARLREAGVDVLTATSTAQALDLLLSRHESVAAVLSDMGRLEAGRYDPKAGVALIQQLRSAGIAVPVFVYTSGRNLASTRAEVQRAGGVDATASPFELFEFLRSVLPSGA